MYLLLVDPGKSFGPSLGVRPDEKSTFRGGYYVYSAARGRKSRKVLKIYKSVHIKPKRSSTKGWCEWVRIFDKV